MLKRFLRWIFGAELKNLEARIKELESAVSVQAQVLATIIEIETVQNNTAKQAGQRLVALEEGIHKFGELSLANHYRLLKIENNEQISDKELVN